MSATRNSRPQVFCWSDHACRFLNGLRRMSNGMLHRFSVVSYVTGQLSNCRAKTDVCFSGIPMNSLCQSFRRLPLFFFFFYIFLSFSFHFPFAGQHEPQASQNSGRGGPGKLPPQLQAGKTPKTNVKNAKIRQAKQRIRHFLPLKEQIERGLPHIAPRWLLLILLLRNPKVFRRRCPTDFFHLRAGISPRSLWTACSWPAGSRRSGTLNIERRNTKNSSRGCPRMSRMYRKKSDTLW